MGGRAGQEGVPGEKGQIRKDEKASEGKSRLGRRDTKGNVKERRVLVEVG